MASGSKLPVCPALLASNRFFTRCKAWLDVKPLGLFSKKMPLTGRPRLRLRANVNDLRCLQLRYLVFDQYLEWTLHNQLALTGAALYDRFHHR